VRGRGESWKKGPMVKKKSVERRLWAEGERAKPAIHKRYNENVWGGECRGGKGIRAARGRIRRRAEEKKKKSARNYDESHSEDQKKSDWS